MWFTFLRNFKALDHSTYCFELSRIPKHGRAIEGLDNDLKGTKIDSS